MIAINAQNYCNLNNLMVFTHYSFLFVSVTYFIDNYKTKMQKNITPDPRKNKEKNPSQTPPFEKKTCRQLAGAESKVSIRTCIYPTSFCPKLLAI